MADEKTEKTQEKQPENEANVEKTTKAKQEKKPEPKQEKKQESKLKPLDKKGEKKTASAKFKNAQISLKSSKVVLRQLKGKNLKRAKAMLEDMISGKHSLRHRYYTKTAKKILEVLKNAEANAKAKAMDEERLFIIFAMAGKGKVFVRPRTRGSRRGEQAKMTHLEIALEER